MAQRSNVNSPVKKHMVLRHNIKVAAKDPNTKSDVDDSTDVQGRPVLNNDTKQESVQNFGGQKGITGMESTDALI